MALDIAEAIAEKKHLIVEAGVGIGKSFAYIVPLLFFHQQYKRPIVISTSTITLQEQLVDDIGRISEILNYPIQIIVAKGQTHYVCRRKVEELPNSKERGALLAAIEKNASERTHFPFAMPDSVWESICISNYGMKVCGKCTFYKDCCFTRLRREMKSTNQAIVCNHDLLTAHLKKEKRFYPGLLPSECPVIVIDEAHNLEDKVRSSLTHEYTKASIEGSALAASDAAVKEGTSIDSLYHAMRGYLGKLYNILNTDVEKQANRNDDYVETGRFFFDPVQPVIEEIERISTILHKLNDAIQIHMRSKVSDQQEMAVDNFNEIVDSFSSLTDIDANIVWLERTGSRSSSLKMCICPRNLPEQIYDLFFDARHIAILTSATLAGQHKGTCAEMYKYLATNIGYPTDSKQNRISGTMTEPKLSPFLYDEHAMMYCADDLPHPTKQREGFLKAGALRIAELVKLSGGRALILFTAKNDMREVHTVLRSMDLPYTILVANAGASQENVLEQFRTEHTSVLLGVGAYWEGINIVGDALTNVIIFKLPFPVPDPIIQDKCDRADNPLLDVLVPEMIIKLKQGIGRLIRSETDRGIISIIDPRLSQKSNSPYRQIVLDSLPIKNCTSDLDVLRAFYGKIAP